MTGKKCRTFRSQSKVVTVLPESGVHIMLFQHRHRDVYMHNSPITGCTTSSNSNELKHVPLQLFCCLIQNEHLHSSRSRKRCLCNITSFSPLYGLLGTCEFVDVKWHAGSAYTANIHWSFYNSTIDRTKLGLLWMFDERQCRNNKTISPQSFQNEESYSSDVLKMMKTYFLLLRDISRKTKILPNLRGSRLSVPNFIAIRPNIPLDYLH